MTVSRFALGLLLISSVNAFWRLPCEKPVLNARVDPIVAPGKPSSHMHTIMGSNAIGYNTTFKDLRNSQCSTCYIKDDRSAYWVPELYYQHKDGSFEAVDHGTIIYYLQPPAYSGYTAQAFPDGLRMLTGNPYVRNNTNTVESQGITWHCIADQPNPTTPGIDNVQCPWGLRAQVLFPSCWDGVNLDSTDHKSHMAFPVGGDSGPCPTSHPVRLIGIFYEVWFNVAPFNKLNDGGRFVLANGDPTGYGLHGDFMNGWDSSVLSRAISTCTVGDGTLEACPVFENEGRIASKAEMDACSAPNPITQDVVGPGQRLPNLPGCIAVTEGPAPATPADLVPGCVPSSANGTATPVTSSV